MSIEDAIKANTLAIEQLTRVMEARSGAGSPAAKTNAAKESAAAEKVEKAEKSAEKAPAKKATAKGKGGAKAVTRAEVSTLTLDLANRFSRDEAVTILKSFGVRSVKDLNEEDFPAVQRQLQAAINRHSEAAEETAEEDDGDDFDLGD